MKWDKGGEPGTHRLKLVTTEGNVSVRRDGSFGLLWGGEVPRLGSLTKPAMTKNTKAAKPDKKKDLRDLSASAKQMKKGSAEKVKGGGRPSSITING